MQEIEHKKGKIYYTMGEVAEMFDVNPSLLRYWEQEFDILKPHRNKKGNRLFTTADVDNIRIIYHLLKERKMKIEVARTYIKTHRKEVDRDAEITERLMNIRSMLLEIKHDLAFDGEAIDDEEPLSESDAHSAADAIRIEDVTGKAAAHAKHEVGADDAPGNISETDREGLAQTAASEEAAFRNFATDSNGSQDEKPPFEEQVLFDIAVPLEMMQTAATGADEGFESAKAAFSGVSATSEEGPEEDSPRTDAIEQTLF